MIRLLILLLRAFARSRTTHVAVATAGPVRATGPARSISLAGAASPASASTDEGGEPAPDPAAPQPSPPRKFRLPRVPRWARWAVVIAVAALVFRRAAAWLALSALSGAL